MENSILCLALNPIYVPVNINLSSIVKGLRMTISRFFQWCCSPTGTEQKSAIFLHGRRPASVHEEAFEP